MNEPGFDRLVATMARLRSPSGCPWDQKQTHQSLRPYLLEEAYEVLEAIDAGDDEELCAELGDVLLQVVFHAQVATERDSFTIDDICTAIVDKLVRRHPHVFGDVAVDDAEQVVVNWERIKKSERSGAEPASTLDGVPKHLPALLRAQRIQDKASRAGFDWDHISGPLEKVAEEFEELRQEWIRHAEKETEKPGDPSDELPSQSTMIEEQPSQSKNERPNQSSNEQPSQSTIIEYGDLLFALVNTARFLELSSEDALRGAVDKFERRFRQVEEAFRNDGRDLDDAGLEEMDRVWEEVKQRES